jgi:hypothetical protein
MRHAHPVPPAPHPPEGCGEEPARGAPTPTIPGLDSSFDSLALLHVGHAGVRLAVTNASNCRSQSWQEYSKMGMEGSYLKWHMANPVCIRSATCHLRSAIQAGPVLATATVAGLSTSVPIR